MNKPLFIRLEQLLMGSRNEKAFFRHDTYTMIGYHGVPVLFAQANFSPSQEQEVTIMKLLREGKVYCRRLDYYRLYSPDVGGMDSA